MTLEVQKTPGFLTTAEVLGYLRINPRTIYRLIRRGELPAVRVGHQWRFRRSDLEAWLDAHQQAGSPTTLTAAARAAESSVNSVHPSPTSGADMMRGARS